MQSFAISPHHPEVLFRCSGEVRSRKFYGSVHKSADGGHSWREVCTGMGFYGNGPTRMYGEVIAADPHHPDIIAAGGYTGGFWISRDEGETWRRTGLPEERFGCVAFHPSVPGVLYAGTISDDDLNMDYVEVGEGGVLGLLQDQPRAGQASCMSALIWENPGSCCRKGPALPSCHSTVLMTSICWRLRSGAESGAAPMAAGLGLPRKKVCCLADRDTGPLCRTAITRKGGTRPRICGRI